MAVLGLRFCARAFSSCGEQGPLFIAVRGPLTITASLVGSTGSRRAGSVVVAHGPSCSTACGIFPDQGSNPRALLWQADSQPLRHQGSALMIFKLSALKAHCPCSYIEKCRRIHSHTYTCSNTNIDEKEQFGSNLFLNPKSELRKELSQLQFSFVLGARGL